jgi:hypothetical protein
VYLLQHNPAEAKKYCPDISPIDGNTGPDKIMLSMFRKLGGQVTRVRLEPAGSSTSASGAHKEHAASCYELGRKKGRPCKEAALSEAAAKLVGQKWREYKQQQARKQRDPKAVKAARASRTTAKFTSRGNAITCAKPAAIVQTAHFCRSWLPHFHCSCGERFKFVESGSCQVGASAIWELQCAGE